MFLCACELNGGGGGIGSFYYSFLFFSFIRSFLETVRGHGGAAAGGSNGYNQSYFEAKN